jgi:hypothetical protein
VSRNAHLPLVISMALDAELGFADDIGVDGFGMINATSDLVSRSILA